VRVHRAREHALELQHLGALADRVEVGDHRVGGRIVALGHRHPEQVSGFVDPGQQRGQRADDPVEQGALAAEFLGPLWIFPDGGILQFAGDFLEALALAIEVKDTP
jgi:hypothetical protein